MSTKKCNMTRKEKVYRLGRKKLSFSLLLGMVVHDYNSSTQKTKAGGLPRVQGQSRVHDEFEVSLGSLRLHLTKIPKSHLCLHMT